MLLPKRVYQKNDEMLSHSLLRIKNDSFNHLRNLKLWAHETFLPFLHQTILSIQTIFSKKILFYFVSGKSSKKFLRPIATPCQSAATSEFFLCQKLTTGSPGEITGSTRKTATGRVLEARLPFRCPCHNTFYRCQ